MATYTQSTADNGAQVRTLSGINLLLGIWLVVSPFVLAMTNVAVWNNVICGAVVFILAVARIGRPAGTQPLSWVNAVIGAWVVISPFVLGFAARSAIWNNVIVGALMLIFALFSAAQRQGYATRTTTGATTGASRASAMGSSMAGAEPTDAEVADAASRMPPPNARGGNRGADRPRPH